MNTDYDAIEMYAMKKLLLDGDEDHAILMEQYNNRISLHRHDISSHGWFTDFTIDVNSQKIAEKKRLVISVNVALPVVGMETGIGVVLFVENGQIDTLEAFSYDDYLPEYIEIDFEAN